MSEASYHHFLRSFSKQPPSLLKFILITHIHKKLSLCPAILHITTTHTQGSKETTVACTIVDAKKRLFYTFISSQHVFTTPLPLHLRPLATTTYDTPNSPYHHYTRYPHFHTFMRQIVFLLSFSNFLPVQSSNTVQSLQSRLSSGVTSHSHPSAFLIIFSSSTTH